MAELVIRSEDIARKLLNLAEREGRSVEELLEAMVVSYSTTHATTDTPKPGTFTALVASALAANIESEEFVDTSSRTKDILNSE